MFCWKTTASLTEWQAIALVWFSYMRPSIQLLLKCLLVEGGTVRVQQLNATLTEWRRRKWRQSFSQTQTVPMSPIFLLSQLHVFATHAHNSHHSQLAMQAITNNGTRKHEIKLLAYSFMLPLAMWQPLILHTVNAIFWSSLTPPTEAMLNVTLIVILTH